MLRTYSDTLFGEQYGSTPARVLALPGWMRQRSDFRLVLDGQDGVAVDLPGFGGASPEPLEATGAAGYAQFVQPVLDACAERVVVVGHSFGGRVAVQLACDHPDRVAGLVLTGVPLLFRDDRPSKPPLRYRAVRWLNARGIVGDDRMEALRRRRGSADYRQATPTMRGVLVKVVNESYEAQLATLDTRVELVWGDDDHDVPLYIAERAAQLLGDHARLTVVPGAGHLTPLTAAAAVRGAIDRLLP
jgi:pimeloyl-ACP methyl ester carboxylesterase